MPTTLIKSNTPKQTIGFQLDNTDLLYVSEFFTDTIQGEGVSTGIASTFLRMKGCTLDCVWCDSSSVWREGHAYSFQELFSLMEEYDVINKLFLGQHLILTGGSPLKQQVMLTKFITQFIAIYQFKPYIEVENECVLMPTPEFEQLVDQWNNSPKLASSEMKERSRYNTLVLSHMGVLDNSWFKFVIDCEKDWQEIQQMYIDTHFIKKEQILLMPCGENQELLNNTRPLVVEMAIRHGVRFCDRLHVTIWDKKTGV